jgi:hypothetical protein
MPTTTSISSGSTMTTETGLSRMNNSTTGNFRAGYFRSGRVARFS